MHALLVLPLRDRIGLLTLDSGLLTVEDESLC